MALCIAIGSNAVARGMCCVAVGDDTSAIGAFQVSVGPKITISLSTTSEELQVAISNLQSHIEIFTKMGEQKHAPEAFVKSAVLAIQNIIKVLQLQIKELTDSKAPRPSVLEEKEEKI